MSKAETMAVYLQSGQRLDHNQRNDLAAELRRLEAEVEELREFKAGYGKQAVALLKLQADKAELLEALKLIASTDPIDAALDPQRAVRVARSAIQKHGAAS